MLFFVFKFRSNLICVFLFWCITHCFLLSQLEQIHTYEWISNAKTCFVKSTQTGWNPNVHSDQKLDHTSNTFAVSEHSCIRNFIPSLWSISPMYQRSTGNFDLCFGSVHENFDKSVKNWNGGLRIAWLLFHFSIRIIHSSQSLQMISIYPCDHSFGLWYFGVFSPLGVEEIPAPEWMLDFIVFRLVCNLVAFWVLIE